MSINFLNWLKNERNIGDLDRLGRIAIAEALILTDYFWLGWFSGWKAAAVLAAAVIMATTAATGFCLAYRLTNTSSYRRPTVDGRNKTNILSAAPFLLVIASLPWVFGHFSVPPTTKAFLNDFTAANGFLKQSIYDADAGIKELTVANFDQWQGKFKFFSEKYRGYRPFVVKGDWQFGADIQKIASDNKEAERLAYSGDLKGVYRKLKGIQAVWMDLVRRNGVADGNVALIEYGRWADDLSQAGVDLNAPHILISYPQADMELRVLELTLPQSAELAGLRDALESLTKASQQGEVKDMPRLGQEFRQAYLRLYVK